MDSCPDPDFKEDPRYVDLRADTAVPEAAKYK
jgi:hypothetical protein